MLKPKEFLEIMTNPTKYRDNKDTARLFNPPGSEMFIMTQSRSMRLYFTIIGLGNWNTYFPW